jgi:sortase (surface protein transpeptidase)
VNKAGLFMKQLPKAGVLGGFLLVILIAQLLGGNQVFTNLFFQQEQTSVEMSPLITRLFEHIKVSGTAFDVVIKKVALSQSTEGSQRLLHPGEEIGVPVRIKIPSIAIDAEIEQVALTHDQLMDVPKKPSNAGWYNLGPRPGEKGSAVIDGHINWYYGVSGVFLNLHELKKGDKIEVLDDKGAIISFVVRESSNYDATAEASEVFYSTDGKVHLNLITCGGVWDSRSKQYTKRLVVFADRE